jgi:hypothetical protein
MLVMRGLTAPLSRLRERVGVRAGRYDRADLDPPVLANPHPALSRKRERVLGGRLSGKRERRAR